MRKKKRLRCICCGKFTLHKEGEWYVHKKCFEEVKYRVLLAKYELPKLGYELLFGSSKLFKNALMAFLNGDHKKIQCIKRDMRKKAWKLLEAKHGKPSWLKEETVKL